MLSQVSRGGGVLLSNSVRTTKKSSPVAQVLKFTLEGWERIGEKKRPEGEKNPLGSGISGIDLDNERKLKWRAHREQERKEDTAEEPRQSKRKR